jgi:hypothetical protein
LTCQEKGKNLGKSPSAKSIITSRERKDMNVYLLKLRLRLTACMRDMYSIYIYIDVYRSVCIPTSMIVHFQREFQQAKD